MLLSTQEVTHKLWETLLLKVNDSVEYSVDAGLEPESSHEAPAPDESKTHQLITMLKDLIATKG